MPTASLGVRFDMPELSKRPSKDPLVADFGSFGALHRRGLRQYDAGQIADAAASLTAALKISPMHAGAWSDLGVVHASAGSLDEAMNCYDRALAIKPNQIDALNNKGNLLAALGRHQDALLSYDRALEISSAVAATHNNRGAVLRQLGRLTEALASFDRALVINRRHVDALNNRGNTLVDLGRPEEALKSYDRALFIDSACGNTIGNRGNALMKLGRPDEALRSYDRALALNPYSAEAHNNRGGALRQLERYDEAVAAFERALALRPANPDALCNLANTLVSLKRPADALRLYDAALQIKPDFATALSNRAQALIELKQPIGALASIEKALALNPGDPDAHNVRGTALLELERHGEALESYDRAISLDPNNPLPHNNRGIALVQLGRIEEGNAAIAVAIGLAPLCGKPYYHLAQSRQFVTDDPILAAMEELTRKSPSLDAEDLINLHFALGKAFADVDDYERSFHHLTLGNAGKRSQSVYDETNALESLARTRGAYTSEIIGRNRCNGNPSEVPVFIVGMPRSGSTLVEQILASHRDIHGAGEIGNFHTVMSDLGGPVAEAVTLPEAVSRISGDQLSQLGTNYLESIRTAAPTARRIINKMLGNFRFVGLMALAMPGARFIHVQRDPIDTCLSCFSTLFSECIPYAYDLEELGRYYRAYEAVMEGWRTVLAPGKMLDVKYESVVADLEGQARRIVEHCGLEWDPNCLDFHRNRRSVRTASMVQVRQPLYKSSVGRWRAYERFLGPLMAQFEPSRRS
jgi:tetratricopeptide (TPR) repeat protein